MKTDEKNQTPKYTTGKVDPYADERVKALLKIVQEKRTLTYDQIENNLFVSKEGEPGKIALEEEVDFSLLVQDGFTHDQNHIYRYDSTFNIERFPCFTLKSSSSVWLLGAGDTRIDVPVEEFLRLANNTSLGGQYLLLCRETTKHTVVTLPFSLHPCKTTTLIWSLNNALLFLVKQGGGRLLHHCYVNTPWGSIPRMSKYMKSYSAKIKELLDLESKELAMFGLAYDEKYQKAVSRKYDALRKKQYEDYGAEFLARENTELMLSLKSWVNSPSVRGRMLYIDFTEEGVVIRVGVTVEEFEKTFKEVKNTIYRESKVKDKPSYSKYPNKPCSNGTKKNWYPNKNYYGRRK